MNAQLEQLKIRFNALQPRERIIVIAGAILVLITAVYALGLAPLYKAVSDRSARVMHKQEDLAWMQSVVAQIGNAGNVQPINNSESLVVVVANTASSANIASSLTGQTPNGANSVRIRLENVKFDDLVLWLGTLQKSFGIRVETADINRSAQPGQVNAGLTLTRGS